MMTTRRFIVSFSALIASLAVYASPAFSAGQALCVECIYDCPASQAERGIVCEAVCQGDFGAAVCSSGAGCGEEQTTIVCEMNPEDT